MSESAGDKKHEASQYRREQAREQGQVARSQDLGSAVLLLGLIFILNFTGPNVIRTLLEIMEMNFSGDLYWTTDPREVIQHIIIVVGKISLALLPLLAAAVLIALSVNWFQIGFLFLPEKLNMDWERINPIKGFERIFSMAGVARLLFSILKIGIIGAIVIAGSSTQVTRLISSSEMPFEFVGGFLWSTVFNATVQTGVILLVLALADFGFQKWKFSQDLMMTDQEVRDEYKQTQGDPALIARRRAVQRQLAQQRIGAAVPKSDVVVTNPTELAIALQYDPETMPAPIVVAKGADAMAKKIRQIALENGIPILERKPLAQALFKSVDIGKPIPVDQYTAVAEVLKYVYQLKGKKMPNLKKPEAA
ncbi:MAG: EscU/YscU/HrcU family type III secretion system export apparatus switch protein [Planctomycetaceae bacterium]|nr:EscU/YscU/HrcU family type III secretion system export apparatus switch protein [Planctomycetaceae bacterium]MBN8602229.1 EscU/YscU/HrcU family type III secretion system export apparatus switch protein [Planctomycetota bacterium]